LIEVDGSDGFQVTDCESVGRGKPFGPLSARDAAQHWLHFFHQALVLGDHFTGESFHFVGACPPEREMRHAELGVVPLHSCECENAIDGSEKLGTSPARLDSLNAKPAETAAASLMKRLR
jgi:hypothetical protein